MPKYTPELKKRRIVELVQRLEKGIDVQARDMALVLNAQQRAFMESAWAKQKALREQSKPKLIAQYELLVKRAAIAHGRHARYDVKASPRSNVLTDRVSKKQELADKAKDAVNVAWGFGTHMVDAATLTGAIVVALGNVNIGAFTNDEAMIGRVMAAAKAEGEKMWQMPLEEDYKDLLKSAFADLSNVGGRAGGSISAAWFLKEFADPTPWVHLDIAGTAWLGDAKP